ncbi:hypothetical protein EJ08DRAFT_646529 [Tothia fuscella]|uniref:Calcium uniporter protein n=1 Tax=Tothia fuscella TaxID=1048955 RepID=A0A9P4U1E3_9PEZI|nr:hypothetical protein EJ08DRAFT_646529 [Tothia fuscella]
MSTRLLFRVRGSWGQKCFSLQPARETRECRLRYISSRHFSVTRPLKVDAESDASHSQPASDLHHEISSEEKSHYDKAIAADKGRQIRTPWHRDGSDKPPVARERSAGAMTKGKLLTTPSRMLKLILPLTTQDSNSDRKDVEPLALLVHPGQPLSYLERLIQSELPYFEDKNGKQRIPNVYFRAVDSMQDGLNPPKDEAEEDAEADEMADEKEDGSHELDDAAHTTMIEGKSEKTGKLNRQAPSVTDALRGGPGEGGVESYSGKGQEAQEEGDADSNKFVRWSSSTEIGDFIRDAARGTEFAVEIEGAPHDIHVGVPSFNDRTYYLRMRLRKKAKEIAQMADIKKECDEIAHRAAKRVAMAGGGALVLWWALVYELTFRTDLGWDVMEPVTYLVGLTTIIGGYGWFLVHNRQVSYRSAMNITISRRQSTLYDKRGFDVRRWEDLIEEGNKLRNEIKQVASEYDVDWDEKNEAEDPKVIKALKEERQKKKEGKKGDKEDDD